MKALTLFMALFSFANAAFADNVYHCVYQGKSADDGFFDQNYVLITTPRRAVIYLEVNKLFDGSDLAAMQQKQMIDVGDITSSENGNLKVTGKGLISQWDLSEYGQPLDKYLLISPQLASGANLGTLSMVTVVHDDRSKDPSKALAPRVWLMTCAHTNTY